MALTATQKQDILYYLGYPNRTLDNTSTHYSNIVDSRMQNLPAEAEARIIAILAEITSVKTQITGSTSKLGVKRVGDIELATKSNETSNSGLKRDLKRLYNELSDYMDIPYQGHVGNRNVSVSY